MEQRQNFEFFHLTDEDMFVDLKLNYMVPEEKAFQARISDNSMLAGQSKVAGVKKGQEFETLPFFLSDEFKQLMNEKMLGTGGPADNNLSQTGNTSSNNGGSSGANNQNGAYKSGFLKDKILEQGEKRKKDKKNKKQGGPGEEAKMGEIALFGSKKKGGRGGGLGEDGLTGEEAQELIDELKNDLKLKEMEYDEMKAQFAKMEAENRRLREIYQTERNERMIIEGKLKKSAIHAELREASEDINQNIFFEKKRSKLSSLNSTLLTTVTNQSLSYFYCR